MKLSDLIKANAEMMDMELELHEEDVVTDAVILLRTARLEDTFDALVIGATKGCGGIIQYGLVCSAKIQVEQWMINGGDEDED